MGVSVMVESVGCVEACATDILRDDHDALLPLLHASWPSLLLAMHAAPRDATPAVVRFVRRLVQDVGVGEFLAHRVLEHPVLARACVDCLVAPVRCRHRESGEGEDDEAVMGTSVKVLLHDPLVAVRLAGGNEHVARSAADWIDAAAIWSISQPLPLGSQGGSQGVGSRPGLSALDAVGLFDYVAPPQDPDPPTPLHPAWTVGLDVQERTPGSQALTRAGDVGRAVARKMAVHDRLERARTRPDEWNVALAHVAGADEWERRVAADRGRDSAPAAHQIPLPKRRALWNSLWGQDRD
jgi:hypothetical protein